jgi:hypothetical protein
MERTDKMSEQVKQLDSQIAALEACIATRTAALKVSQDKWDDWRSGTLRAALGVDQINLHNLRLRRDSLAPASEKRSSAVFYSSNS